MTGASAATPDLPPHEVRTWAEIHDGDRIALPRSVDTPGFDVLDVARQGPLASVRLATGGAWVDPITPPREAPVARTMRGPVTVAIDTLRSAGLDVEAIEQ